MDLGYEYKQFTIDLSRSDTEAEIKNGEVLAKVASMDIPDYEDDVIVKNSVGRQEILVSSWNHSCKQLFGAGPVGMGFVMEDGDNLLADVKYFMDTPESENAFKTVKNLKGAARWSIAYLPIEADYKELHDDNVYRVLRYLIKMKVDETSPVDNPGGVGTGTVDVKHKRPSIQTARNLDMMYEIHKRRSEMYAQIIGQ